jgi:F-type H+-transporting ATPase subunit gamma
MRMVAAARLRKAQASMEAARPYAFKINALLKELIPQINRDLHPLLAIREPEHIGIVVITADRGLCGSYNTHIIRKAAEIIHQYSRERVMLICIGRKGRDHFRRRGYEIIGEYTDFFKELNFEHAIDIVEKISHLYITQGLDRVDIVFNEFKNVLQQRLVVQQFLPLVLEEGEEPIPEEFVLEPSQEMIVQTLIPHHLNVQMWRNLLEANAAEQAARMTAMENATDNATEMITHLTLIFNKARQAAITKEMLEIVGGAEAQKIQREQ